MGIEPGKPTAPEPDAPDASVRSRADDPPPVRASDDERFHTVERLGEHAATGRLTLAELEDRVSQAYAATTRDELAVLLRDLPASTEPADAGLAPRSEGGAVTRIADEAGGDVERAGAARPARRPARWFFAIMGGSAWRGRRRLRGNVNIVSIMGGDDIDLRQAEIEGDELVMTLVSIMGGPSIYVPDTVEVEFSGPAIMGGNDERGSTREPRPGAPVIRIRAFSLMGGAELWRLPAETQGMRLKDAKKLAKEAERGR